MWILLAFRELLEIISSRQSTFVLKNFFQAFSNLGSLQRVSQSFIEIPFFSLMFRTISKECATSSPSQSSRNWMWGPLKLGRKFLVGQPFVSPLFLLCLTAFLGWDSLSSQELKRVENLILLIGFLFLGIFELSDSSGDSSDLSGVESCLTMFSSHSSTQSSSWVELSFISRTLEEESWQDKNSRRGGSQLQSSRSILSASQSMHMSVRFWQSIRFSLLCLKNDYMCGVNLFNKY